MASARYCAVVVALFIGGMLLRATAQTNTSAPAAQYQELLNSVDGLMRGPDRSDIPFSVHLRTPSYPGTLFVDPWRNQASTLWVEMWDRQGARGFRPAAPISNLLLFMRRNPVYFSAVVPYTFVNSGSHDLLLFVRIADRTGRPLYEVASHPSFPANTNHNVQWRAVLWGSPGDYAASVVLYDNATKQTSVWHGGFTVPGIEKDDLPGIDARLPQIALTGDYARVPGPLPRFRLKTRRTLQIDVVADISETIGGDRRDFSGLRQTMGASFIVSHLQPGKGCVRLTTLNALRAQILLDGADPGQTDWDALFRSIYRGNGNRNTIDISALNTVQEGPAFLRDRLTRILSSTNGCAGLTEPPLHVVILVAPGIHIGRTSKFKFLSKTELDPGQLPHASDYRLYYLQTSQYQFVNHLRNMLKPANERFFMADSAAELRRALARIIAELEEPATGRN